MTIRPCLPSAVARAFAIGAFAASLLAAGCTSTPVPLPFVSASASASVATLPIVSTDEPEATDAIDADVAGPWLPKPIELDDRHVAVISDACAVAARETLGDDYADLPTALVDARGERFAIAIFGDDLTSIECEVTLDEDGRNATVDRVDRLSAKAVEAVDGSRLTVATYVFADDRSRTIAFGRVGSELGGAVVSFDDGSKVDARTENGWWAAWWPGTPHPRAVAAVSGTKVGIATLPPAKGQVEARVGPASWWLDPAKPTPNARSTEIHAQVLEQSCASEHSSAGRIEPPEIQPLDDSIVVTFTVRHLPGGQDCQGHGSAPFTIRLPEPLGNRRLLDGNDDPPRDAAIVPNG